MKNQKRLIFSGALVLIAGTAFALAWLHSHQKLGPPGVTAVAISGSVKMKIELPERVLDFNSTNVPEPEIVLNFLPPDTSYAERCYFGTNGWPIFATVILMGADRTSIHNAEYCLTGSGFTGKEKSVVNIPIAGEPPYQLSVARWNLSGDFTLTDGQKVKEHAVCVFWFVTAGEETPDHFQFMKRVAWNLLTTGVLQRWAYVLYIAPCPEGQEDATFERVKKLIAHSVPEFQQPPVRR